MSKTPSNFVHALIHSLTKQEKRYFKLYNSKQGADEGNHYNEVFDAILAQENYDEPALIEEFKKEAFTKRFAVFKGRLYDAVLRSLHAYHASSSVDAELKKMLHCAEILFQKTLYKQCTRMLNQAKKLAIKHDKFTTLLEIYMWEKKTIEKDNYSWQGEKEVEEILAKDKELLALIENYCEFWNIKSRFFLPLYKGGKARNEEERDNFNRIITHPLLQDESNALSAEAKYLYHHIYSAHFFSICDYEKSYEHLIANAKTIETFPELFDEEPNTYFSILTNAIYIGNQLQRYEESEVNLKKLIKYSEKLKANPNQDLQLKLFSSVLSLELTIYVQTAQYEKGLEIIPTIEEGLEKYRSKINPIRISYFNFNMAVLYYGLGRYSDSLKKINLLLNDPSIDQSEDIYSFTQILSLIIHLKLGNKELIPYITKSTHRYLKKRKRVYRTEKTLLDFFNKLSRSPLEAPPREDFLQLQNELNLIVKDPLENATLEYFNFIAWAESYILSKPYGDLVKDKVAEAKALREN